MEQWEGMKELEVVPTEENKTKITYPRGTYVNHENFVEKLRFFEPVGE